MGTSAEVDRIESRGAAPEAAALRELQRRTGSEVQLQWFKAPGGAWPAFDAVGPEQVDHHGVFVVWRNGNVARVSAVLYVGRGSMRQELARCQRDPVFRDARDLYVTWARISDVETIDSVAAYLYQKLRPLWGEIVHAPPLSVNTPWAA